MKFIPTALGLAVALQLSTAVAAPLETLEQRLSYILGQSAANQLNEIGLKLDEDAFKLALEEAALKDASKRSLSDKAIQEAIGEARKIGAEKAQKAAAEAAKVNVKEGDDYRAANAKKEGVTVTESGLQYKEITAGDGEKPKSTDKVKVHYKGSLINGKVFDSSYDRGAPATFPCLLYTSPSPRD